MKFSDYRLPDTGRLEYSDKYFIATDNGTDYQVEDIIRERQKVNIATDEIISTAYFNVSTGTELTVVPNIATLDPFDGTRKVLTSESLTVTDVAAGFATIPQNATHAELQVYDADIVFTVDGATAPTSTGLGIRVAEAQALELESRDEILNFSAIRAGNQDAKIYVQYFFDANANA